MTIRCYRIQETDDDWDAQRGAVLVYPRRIISVRPLDPAEVEAAC